MRETLAVVIVVYVLVMFAIGLLAKGRVQSTEDFLVAGRRLPLSLAGPTLLATWFGAGTLATATDEIRTQGLQAAALEPLGTGFCLILAGLFFAKPLWEAKLLTLPEFFGRNFGSRAEILGSVIMIPGYFGWIAAQFWALAEALQYFFDVPIPVGIVLSASVGMFYTLIGGMWSVTLTDALQMGLLLLGVTWLGFNTFELLSTQHPQGAITALEAANGSQKLSLIPHETTQSMMSWLGVFAIGALGNLPGQDLTQRIFASKSASVARRACFFAGAVYLSFGMIPALLGLAANVLLPDTTQSSTIVALADHVLSPGVMVIFVVALLSAILSTIDSAILSPSSVLAQNLVGPWLQRNQEPGATKAEVPLWINRASVVVVTLCSLAFAFSGSGAYQLLEEAYALGMVALLAPLILGLRYEDKDDRPILAAMIAPTLVWLLHLTLGWASFFEPLWSTLGIENWATPTELSCTVLGFLVYFLLKRAVLNPQTLQN